MHALTGSLGRGFLAPGIRLALLTEADLTGSTGTTTTRDMRKMPSRRRNAIDPLALRPGDYVVHEQHGVGKFLQMAQRTVQGATREYLLIEYGASKRGQPPDQLFVPTDQLDQVTRYVGGEAPTLNKLGGSDWAKTKGRARKAVKQIAAELIRLYSARMASPGYAFSPDTPWQRELEDAFAYVETPDQLATIDEVKADMERPIPMDRLVCGDVGYGKTEIAVRAAFKAVQDGKQVAILVPTTLLVQQHIQTFSDRYAPFPVVVKALSRFVSDAEARAVIEGLADGSVDIVIGTHRLLTGQVRFKDLGLVVVDEEQRFGVEHKESLKTLRTAVDVLAMSATPIPRTLEMAVTGIREMSTLATPPEERHPVLTFVGAYEEQQVTAAIRRELLREGQVFFVHNKVSSIERMAARLRELVPEARIETAHGQLGEHKLEQVVVDFWEKKFDVLVCTTIIETGLDISNANTLVSDRADLMGLSQLHQLRGRVGRGRERAYAYFMYPPGAPAHRDRHRPAADHRPAHRPRRRHAGGHEGPGDPRGGQPARRRAVRPHRGRRVRPLHPAGGRGRGRLPRRRRAAAGRGQDRAAGRRAPAARLRAGGAAAARGLQEAGVGRDRRGARGDPVRAGRPLRRHAAARREPARGRPAAGHRPPGRAGRRRAPRASTCGSARSTCGRASSCGWPGSTPGRWSSPRVHTVLVPRPEDRAAWAASRCATGRCWSGPASVIEAVLLDDLAAAATVASSTAS